jgi:hypothetical protein
MWGHLGKKIENCTMVVIVVNALFMVVDAHVTARFGKKDNLYEREAFFGVMANLFTVYFLFEIVVRVLGYREKVISVMVRDAWLLFDSMLVALMILETWILPLLSGQKIPGVGVLRLFRLLRLSKLAKSFPEFMVIVKGLFKAVRAVFWSFFLLSIITVMYSILFTNQFHRGSVPHAELEESNPSYFFGTVEKSAYSLIVHGAIFDDLTMCADSLADDMFMRALFVSYMIISGFIIMNMLIGILAAVIASTQEDEDAANQVEKLTTSILKIASEMDTDHNQGISQAEFETMKERADVLKELKKLDIDKEMFSKFGELVFSDAKSINGTPASVDFHDLIKVIRNLRPGTDLSALGLVNFKQSLETLVRDLTKGIRKIEFKATELATARRRAGSISNVQATSTPMVMDVSDDADETAPTTADDTKWNLLSTEDIMEEVQNRLRANAGSQRVAAPPVKLVTGGEPVSPFMDEEDSQPAG